MIDHSSLPSVGWLPLAVMLSDSITGVSKVTETNETGSAWKIVQGHHKPINRSSNQIYLVINETISRFFVSEEWFVLVNII